MSEETMVCKGGSASLMLGLSTKYPRVNSNRQISSAIRCTCNLSVVGKLNCGAVWEQKVFRKYQMKKLVRNKCSADGLVAGLDMRHRCLSQNARRINEKNAFRIKAAARSEEDVIDVEGKIIDTRIPTTILTGFLGSGKTTLLNHILSHDHGHKIAVIENEFGEIDVDSDLVSVQEDIKGEGQIMMLNNGCLCCTVRGDLVRILDELVRHYQSFSSALCLTSFCHLSIEFAYFSFHQDSEHYFECYLQGKNISNVCSILEGTSLIGSLLRLPDLPTQLR